MNMQEEEINLLDYIKVISRWKRFIISFTLIIFVLTFIFSLFVPKIFRAETTIIVPQQGTRGLESVMALTSILSGSTINVPTDISQSLLGRTTNFSDILKSKTISEMIVNGLRLDRHYNVAKKDSMIARIQKKIKVKEQRGILKITVDDRDPRLAADIANYSILALDEFNKKGNTQYARRLKNFILEQLAAAKIDLNDAEEKLKKFETQSQMVKISQKELMLVRLMRDVKVQEAVYTMLLQEHEKTRLDEAKEELFFEVLDPARTPRSPYSPKPLLYSMIALVMGGLVSVFTAFVCDYLESLGLAQMQMEKLRGFNWF